MGYGGRSPSGTEEKGRPFLLLLFLFLLSATFSREILTKRISRQINKQALSGETPGISRINKVFFPRREGRSDKVAADVIGGGRLKKESEYTMHDGGGREDQVNVCLKNESIWWRTAHLCQRGGEEATSDKWAEEEGGTQNQ